MIEIDDTMSRFASSVGVGLLMGLVRERHAGTQAGVRTYALVAMLGCVSALLSQQAGAAWMLPAGLIALAGMMVVAMHTSGTAQDAGTTSTVAVMVCFCIGAAIWVGPMMPAVALGLVATALLHFKPELESFATRLTSADVRSLLRFAVVSLLILPLLPDEAMGPYDAFNPYRTWWMVVLISGLGLTGYLLLQLFGSGRGVFLLGLLGGVVSSTATSLTFARIVRDDRKQVESAHAVILLAHLVVLLRLALLSAVVSPAAMPKLLPVLVAGAFPGVLLVTRCFSKQQHPRHDLIIQNPGEMAAALSFGALFALVQIGVAWLDEQIGVHGVYLAAAMSGLLDLDAIALSAMQRFATDVLAVESLVVVIVIAYIASLLFKFGMIAIIAGQALAMRMLLPFALIAAGLVLGAICV